MGEILAEEQRKYPPDGRPPGSIDPEDAARILGEYFANITFEEFNRINGEASFHLYEDSSRE